MGSLVGGWSGVISRFVFGFGIMWVIVLGTCLKDTKQHHLCSFNSIAGGNVFNSRPLYVS